MLLSRKRVLLAKTEVTYGTDPTPSGAANAILVRSLDVTPLDADIVSRDLVRPYMGNFEQIIAAERVMVTFEVELQGSGTAGTAPAVGPLLRACGLSETIVALTSVTYAPVSSSFDSVTLYFQAQDSVSTTSPLHKITGARGNVELMASVKGLPVLKFTMTGLYNATADAANLTADYTAFKTPLAVNKANTPTFSFFGYSAVMSDFSLNLNNQIVHRNLINSESVLLTDRKAGGTVVFEAPLTVTHDFWADAIGTTLGSMSLVHGTVAGSIAKITATSTVDITSPTYTDQNGVLMLSVPYVLVPGTGNDEFSLAFT